MFFNKKTFVCIILFTTSVKGKYDKLAYTLKALYVLLIVVLVHIPRSYGDEVDLENMTAYIIKEKEPEMDNFFRNIMTKGALMGISKFVAKNKRMVR